MPQPQRIAEAVRLLAQAQRPVIIAGGGIHYAEAWSALQTFAETFGIPVGETFAGKGALRHNDTLLLGGYGVTGTPAAAQIVAAADLVICIGTRLTDFTTGSHSVFQHPDVKFIHINVSSHDAYKLGALPIIADARAALQALVQAGQAAGIQPQPAYLDEVAAVKTKWQRQLNTEVYIQHAGEALSQGQLVGILNEEAQAGDTIIAAAGSPPGDLHKLWSVHNGTHCHLEFGYSCMGYELPAGLGVRMAQPQGEVYVLIGDGTYLMNPSELVTAVQEGLKVTVIVSENHGYQVIRQLQMNRVGHSFGNEFRARDAVTRRLEGDYLPIDFAKNAESMGARTWRATTAEQVRAALQAARQETQTCVIVVETEKHRYLPGSNVWWDVASAEVTNDAVTYELRKAYEEDRDRLQRFYY